MLKTTGSPDKLALSKNNGSKSTSNRYENSRLASGKNNGNDKIHKFDNMEYAKKSEKLKSQKLTKSQKLSKLEKLKGEKSKKLSKIGNSSNFNAMKVKPSFLTSNARTTFNHLQLIFTQAPILWQFDLEYYIWIETDILGYAISGIFGQQTSRTSLNRVVTKANLSLWHLVAFFSKKIIPAETWYKTHNSKLFAIVKVFKTWRHYLEGCKHKVFDFYRP